MPPSNLVHYSKTNHNILVSYSTNQQTLHIFGFWGRRIAQTGPRSLENLLWKTLVPIN